MVKEEVTISFFSPKGCVKSERVRLSKQKNHERGNLHIFIIMAETIH